MGKNRLGLFVSNVWKLISNRIKQVQWINMRSWVRQNFFSIVALIISVISLYHSVFRVDNSLRATLMHHEVEDFFVIHNDGNQDQVLIDYKYGLKYSPEENYIGSIQPRNADPIVIKPGEKKIIKPEYSLLTFIQMVADTMTIDYGNGVTQKNLNPIPEEIPFIIGFGFTYVEPNGDLSTKYYDYAIHHNGKIVTDAPELDDTYVDLIDD